MSDADDLAQRYMALWTQYLTALLADPRAMETLKRWVAFTGQFSYPGSGGGEQVQGSPFPAWPPFFGPFGVPSAPAGNTDALAKLAQRVDELERRLAAFERPKKSDQPKKKPRPRGKGGGSKR